MLDVVYRVGPPRKKWRISMLTERVSVLSNAPVGFSVAVDRAGVPYDPRAGTVEMAAKSTFDAPTAPDWKPGAWDVSVIGQYTAEINPGPAGMNLAQGTYYMWIRITDAVAGVTLIDPTGTLVVQ